MSGLGLETEVVDRAAYRRTVERFRDLGVVLPTFQQLSEPSTISAAVRESLDNVDPDAPHPLNLFRVHWHNDRSRRRFTAVPEHIVLPESLTGVKAAIIVVFGDPFPMIRAHKVLAAYACLAPRLITGRFDPVRHKALWPSTGNYCRGGVAISRISGCRGVAILPAGMSEERFRWLEAWVTDRSDIIRTPGTESNVKEIYDACAELSRDPANVVFNQFREFGNYLAHYQCTGRALERVVDHVRRTRADLVLRGFVSATGSAGTLAAGDYLKERYGSQVIAAEALECPTLLENGFGEHNIQGIGDKHVPFIHNVMNTDLVVAVSDRSTDQLGLLFNSVEGHQFLGEQRHVDAATIESLRSLGLSSICNVIAAIKTARHLHMDERDAIITVATDGAEMYATERQKAIRKYFGGSFDATTAAQVFGQHVLGAGVDNLLELTERERRRIFNLGYFTWVEQQGVPIADFVARRDPAFWRDLRSRIGAWDEMIVEFNRAAGGRAVSA